MGLLTTVKPPALPGRYDFQIVASTLGWTPSWTVAHFILPVGISFYTFQAMSYTIDVYRRRLTAHRSYIEFCLFIGFFPQLMAGPIERAGTLLPQISGERRLAFEEVRRAGWLLLVG